MPTPETNITMNDVMKTAGISKQPVMTHANEHRPQTMTDTGKVIMHMSNGFIFSINHHPIQQ